MKRKKLASLALAGALTLGLLPALSAPALAAEPETTYILTIPSALTVSGSGWNALEGGISAKGTLESGKKLVVTPTSENSWNLVANKGEETESKVGYNLAKEIGTYRAAAEAPTWEFTELTADGTSQTAGIIVDDYSTKPAGTYTDTVTFTASVEDARQLHSFTLIGPYTGDTLVVEFYEGQTWSDMAAKYSKLRIIRDWIGFGSDGMIYKNSRDWVLTTDTVDPNATYTIE